MIKTSHTMMADNKQKAKIPITRWHDDISKLAEKQRGTEIDGNSCGGDRHPGVKR